MNLFSSKNREKLIAELCKTQYDLLVIGGGITGAGIALDATARGLKVALVDMQDFAAGTSSRSTKLIHGGLRYLKQFEFALVAEVGHERKIIHRNAPHLTKPEPMLLPITKKGSFGKWSTKLGMVIYEWLAGVKKDEYHQVLSAEETMLKEPLLEKENLLGGVLFYEYRTDDARLTLEVIKEAVNRGALPLNYLKVTGFTYQNRQINGAIAKDMLNEKACEIRANYVINASGPWVDELDSLDNTNHGNKLQITKGVHLVVDHEKLPVKQSLYFDTYDKRMMFIIPREGKTYIGTTDTFYSDNKTDPTMSADDRLYVLKCLNDYFPSHPVQLADVESGWVGLRPLIRKPGKKPSEISRRDETFVWNSGLITIAGGKLTGYRKMAERVLDKVGDRMLKDRKKNIAGCTTDKIHVSGGELGDKATFAAFVKSKVAKGIEIGLTGTEAEKLASRYGSNTDTLFEIFAEIKSHRDDKPELSLALYAQLVYAIDFEMCLTPLDFFVRRTGMLFFDIMTVKSLQQALLHDMQKLLGWSDEQKLRYGQQLQLAIMEVG